MYSICKYLEYINCIVNGFCQLNQKKGGKSKLVNKFSEYKGTDHQFNTDSNVNSSLFFNYYNVQSISKEGLIICKRRAQFYLIQLIPCKYFQNKCIQLIM